MEMFLFRHDHYAQLYNCSGIQIDSIPLAQRTQFVPEAWASMSLSTIYFFLYIPCLFSIWRHCRHNPCYQMLFYMGCLDLCILPVLGFLHGWLALQGAVFCSYPTLIYWAGSINNLIWFTVSTVDLALAINRCLEIIRPTLSQKLFSGRRVFIWISLCSIYGLYWSVFEKPSIFSSVYFAWFFFPFVGYREDTQGQFSISLHNFHDLTVAIASPLIYLLFAIALKFKSNAGGLQISHAQKMTFLQIFIISAINTLTGSIYVWIQHTEPAQWLITLGEFAWLHVHGFPPVIFLVFNKTIRNDCRRYLRKIFPKNRINQVKNNNKTVVASILISSHVNVNASNFEVAK